MQTPSAGALLAVWERGQRRDMASRGLLLLEAAHPDSDPDALANIALGHRNRLLLALRRLLFGAHLDAVTSCSGCQDALETRFTVPDEEATVGATPTAEAHRLSSDGYRVAFRLPTSADVRKLPKGDGDEALVWLLRRCVVEARHGDRDVSAESLPADVMADLGRAMVDLDPDGVLEVSLVCPDCGHQSVAVLDPAAFLWDELDQWAWRTLRDVAELASGYGWSESDILRLSPWRRQVYLGLLPT